MRASVCFPTFFTLGGRSSRVPSVQSPTDLCAVPLICLELRLGPLQLSAAQHAPPLVSTGGRACSACPSPSFQSAGCAGDMGSMAVSSGAAASTCPAHHHGQPARHVPNPWATGLPLPAGEAGPWATAPFSTQHQAGWHPIHSPHHQPGPLALFRWMPPPATTPPILRLTLSILWHLPSPLHHTMCRLWVSLTRGQQSPAGSLPPHEIHFFFLLRALTTSLLCSLYDCPSTRGAPSSLPLPCMLTSDARLPRPILPPCASWRPCNTDADRKSVV